MQTHDQTGQRRWDDVLLTRMLTKAQPEPLTLDGRSDTAAVQHTNDAAKSQRNMQSGPSYGDTTDELLGLELGSLMEAEPMTREEADAFDASPMDACFLELQMFSLSSMEGGHQPSTAASAPGDLESTDAGREGLPHTSRKSTEYGCYTSNGQSSYASRGIHFSEATDSNRSSFETVQYDGQRSMAGAAMQTGLFTESSQPGASPQTRLSSPCPDVWHASSIFGQSLVPTSRDNRVTSRQHGHLRKSEDRFSAARSLMNTGNSASTIQPNVRQAAALQAFGLPEVQTTPALRQSAMQLSLGMDVGTGLNLNNWQYGSEAPSVSMVLEAMDCHVSDSGCQPAGAKAQERLLEKSAKAEMCQKAQLTSAMIPPVTAYAPPACASEAEHCECTPMQDVASVPERYGKLPRLKVEALEDPMQQSDVPLSAPGRCSDLKELAGMSPKGPCRSLGGDANQRMESLERYRDKKRRRLFSGAKTIRYEKRKVNADRRPRVKGRFVKQSEFDDMQH